MQFKATLKRRFPSAWAHMRATKQLLTLAPRVFGYEPRYCAICGNKGKFIAEVHFPDIFVFDAICPKCGSQPRQRLLKLALASSHPLPADARVLHFAPEPCVTSFVKPIAGEYRTADLFAQPVDFKLNIETIEQPDMSWDAVICSHVLEHVNHRRAIAELFRILKPGGKLYVLIPVVDGWKEDYENPIISSPRDRGLHFGKDNHLRRFGSNVRHAFTDVGFNLATFSPIGPEVVSNALIPGETLFVAERPAA